MRDWRTFMVHWKLLLTESRNGHRNCFVFFFLSKITEKSDHLEMTCTKKQIYENIPRIWSLNPVFNERHWSGWFPAYDCVSIPPVIKFTNCFSVILYRHLNQKQATAHPILGHVYFVQFRNFIRLYMQYSVSKYCVYISRNDRLIQSFTCFASHLGHL